MNVKSILRVLFCLTVQALLLGTSGPVSANGPDNPNAAARKIVIFHDQVTGDAVQGQIVAQAGATKIKHLPLINASVVMANAASERALRQRAEVLRIDGDAVVNTQAKRGPTLAPETLPWGVHRVGADRVWDTDHNLAVDPGANAGGGVKVAVLDTGIDLTHPDLQDNIKGGINTISSSKNADDDNGHGSHVTGIIAGVDNTIGAVGVAAQSSLYAVKVLDRTGSGYTSDVIEGLQWCIDNGMQVANMSFGLSVDVPSFHDAIKKAYASGIVLVAAAGNSGPAGDTVMYPARYAEAIAVSATDTADTTAGFSSRGSQVALAAPGVNIFSTYKGGSYKTLSGTSMASPHVAGAAALAIASGVTGPDKVRAKLQSTAYDLGASGFDNLYGNGLVDVQNAITGVRTLP